MFYTWEYLKGCLSRVPGSGRQYEGGLAGLSSAVHCQTLQTSRNTCCEVSLGLISSTLVEHLRVLLGEPGGFTQDFIRTRTPTSKHDCSVQAGERNKCTCQAGKPQPSPSPALAPGLINESISLTSCVALNSALALCAPWLWLRRLTSLTWLSVQVPDSARPLVAPGLCSMQPL